MYSDGTEPALTEEEREAFMLSAMEAYNSECVNVQGEAAVSPSRTGAWVAAWVWVSRDAAGLEER